MTSFAQVFQRSRFAAAVPGQVFAQSSALPGEFGLKHSLPAAAAPKAITVPVMDDPTLKKSNVRSAKLDVLSLGIWKENFVDTADISKAQADAPLALAPVSGEQQNSLIPPSSTSISRLSPEEWALLLYNARARRSEFQTAVNEGKVSLDDWDAFLGIQPLIRAPKALRVHPPVYSAPPSSKVGAPRKVWGRILNSVAEGFAVGVAGLVAFLPKREATIDELLRQRSTVTSFSPASAYTSSMANPASLTSVNRPGGSFSKNFTVDRESLFQFYVTRVTFDDLGRPEILLSMKAPLMAEAADKTGSSEPSLFFPPVSSSSSSHPSLPSSPSDASQQQQQPRANLHVMALLKRLKERADSVKTDVKN